MSLGVRRRQPPLFYRKAPMPTTHFIFDLGNTVIKLAYERVIEKICRESNVNRDQLLEIFEQPGGYRDMERGAAPSRSYTNSSATGAVLPRSESRVSRHLLATSSR